MKRGPYNTKRKTEFQELGEMWVPGPSDPLRVHRAWYRALKLIFPDAKVTSQSFRRDPVTGEVTFRPIKLDGVRK